MDKQHLLKQLAQHLEGASRVAARAKREAEEAAQSGVSAKERRQDTRVALSNRRMAHAQGQRAQQAKAALERLARFTPKPLANGARVVLGAIVEIENESGEGRTFFLAPVGAGIELTGPDGDGFLSVVTPASPMGKAVLGCQVGDFIEIEVKGEIKEWEITYVG